MSSMSSRKYESTRTITNALYSSVPAFNDVFEEETFYIFAFCFTVFTILVCVLLSRFVKLKPVD